MWIKCVPLWIVFVVFCLAEILPYYGYEMYSLLPALIGIGFVLKLSFVLQCYVKKSLLGTVILTISSASYIIYLLHTTFEGMAKALVLKTPYISNCSNDWMFTMGAFIVILTGVIVPIILYKYVLGNSRITRFLFGLK